MALTKVKLNKDRIKKAYDDAESGGSSKRDPRVVPYFKLDFDQKMSVILIPYPNGDLFKKFSKHGPNLQMPGVGTIGCMRENQRDQCPICQHGFDIMQDDKEEGLKWMPKDYFVYQCVVVDSPVELEQLPDNNEARILYAPKAVHDVIHNAIKEGLIDDPTEHEVVIKKTKRKNSKNATYENSYVNQLPIPDDVVEAFEGAVIDAYDLESEWTDGDGDEHYAIVPPEVDEDEATEWLDNAIQRKEKMERSASRKVSSRRSGSDDNDDDDDDSSDRKNAVQSRLRKRSGSMNRSSSKSDDDDGDEKQEATAQDDGDQQEDDAPAEKPAKTEKKSSRSVGGLRGRINRG